MNENLNYYMHAGDAGMCGHYHSHMHTRSVNELDFLFVFHPRCKCESGQELQRIYQVILIIRRYVNE